MTYVDFEVGVKQDLEIVVLLTSISYYETGLQILAVQCHGIGQSEWVIPFRVSDLAIR